MCLFAKRLERGRFIWPSPADGTVAITPAVCRSTPGVRRRPADCGILNHCTAAGSQEARLVFPSCVMSLADSLPDDVETLKRLVLAREAEQADAANARAEASSAEALIAH
jgi:hypothetical protein